jgi:hypothetical protein
VFHQSLPFCAYRSVLNALSRAADRTGSNTPLGDPALAEELRERPTPVNRWIE